MRKALIIGIDHYSTVSDLHGCVNDAHAMNSVLARNGDGTINFDVNLLTASSSSDVISRASIKSNAQELFSGEDEIALFYFAGHGHVESTGGYLCGSDCETGDDGFPLSELLSIASRSNVQNKMVVLDSCHSGVAGSNSISTAVAELVEGTTILTASTAEQYANEENGSGVFTKLLVDALNGSAANLVGEITPGSVYAHIDQSLGPWDQRPMFKTNVNRFVSLRKVQAPIELGELRRIAEFFPSPDFEFQLDPSFEPESENPNPTNTAMLALLQKYNRVNLVVPVNAPHMYFAAMESKSCKLTVLGEHYLNLVKRNRI